MAGPRRSAGRPERTLKPLRRASRRGLRRDEREEPPFGSENAMLKFLLFCLLLVVCWPLAVFALLAYPVVWLLLLPFKLVGVVVAGVLSLMAALLLLPFKLVTAI